MSKRFSKLVLLLLVLSLFFVSTTPTASAADPIRVFYAGPAGGVRTALELAHFELVRDPAQAQVFVLNDATPDPETVAARVRGGAGLVLFLGPELDDATISTLLGVPVSTEARDDALSIDKAPGVTDALVEQVLWNSAPQVRERTVITATGVQPLVKGYQTDQLILGTMHIGHGAAYLFAPLLINGSNPQIQDWAYFNYLVYHLVVRAAGQTPLSFGDYPASPVPHAAERTFIFGILAAMLVTAVVAFVLVRRYSLAHPEELDAIVADREKYATREAHTDWSEIGFHRPLGGFLLALMLGLVLFIPLILYQNWLLPNYILPSAQALGIWGRVMQLFQVAWWFFDMGTSEAFIKYLAEYRITDPRKGIQYGQLFLWWQALSGAVQVALIVALSSTLMPRSTYALYAWSVIIHTLIQLPGFYQIFRNALTGLQRFDYAQILDLSLGALLPMLTQPIIVILMFSWGKRTPAFGGPMGGLFGLGLAAYASEVITFLLGLWLYRRLGYNARILFLAHFDWKVIWNSFRFGVFQMLGSVAWTLGQAAEIFITQVRMINYAEVWGNWTLAYNFIFAYQVLQTLYGNVMPAISEAISHGRQVLSQYYAVQSYRYGAVVSAFIGSVLLAVADRFILGASGPEFTRAAELAVLLILWGAVQYPSWVGDNVQLAANRPYLKSAMVTGEQIIRVVLALVLLTRFQINALIIAYFVGLLAKDILAYLVNDRFCFPQRFYPWQSLAAPLLAGAVHYAILRWVTGLIWKGDLVTSGLIFFIGILLSFPLFAFLYGLFGGWDDDTLAELRRAVNLSNFMRPLAWVFWAANALGARLSPLHGRFPIDIRPAAQQEAQSLMGERVEL